MNSRVVKSAPMMAWILAALSALLCHLAGKTGWVEVAAVGVLCTGLNYYRFRNGDDLSCGEKWYAVVVCVSLALVTGIILKISGKTWPTGETAVVVPMVLLLLALWGAWEGAEKASRTGSVLMWFLVVLFAAVVAGGIGNVKLSRIEMSAEVSNGLVYLVFLIPGSVAMLPRKKGAEKLLWILPVFGCMMSLLVAGVLSGSVAKELEDPFYELGKSLSLFGVVERYESLVSAALTIGYFCLLMLLLSTAYHLTETAYQGNGRKGLLLTALGSALTMNLPLESFYLLAILVLVIWYAIPPAINNGLIKKLKIHEKNT